MACDCMKYCFSSYEPSFSGETPDPEFADPYDPSTVYGRISGGYIMQQLSHALTAYPPRHAEKATGTVSLLDRTLSRLRLKEQLPETWG
jgi:hypothetical protein